MDLKIKDKLKGENYPIKIIIIAISITVFIIISSLINRYYNNHSIIGKWQSLDTGIIVEFTEEGVVKVDNMKSGDYTINSNNSMTYTIEEYDFEMNYMIDGRKLYWGLEGEEEKFQRNGL